METKNYRIKIENNRLTFKTFSFRAEKGSVLHEGVYTKEFASMLFSSAVCIAAYQVMVYVADRIAPVHFLYIILLFIISFLGSRKFLFKERYQKVVFNKKDNTATISRPGLLKKNTEKIPLDRIRSVEVGSEKFTPENINGIKFVEKISLQHGSYTPGLADVEEFVTLTLKLTDGSDRVLFAGRIEEEPILPIQAIKDFLGK
jgi:hypothetical protein